MVDSTREVSLPYGVDIKDVQSNYEGELIDFMQKNGPDSIGIIINPAAFSHYSIALRDCLEDINKPTVEVHISNIHKREAFRHHSVISAVSTGVVAGLGLDVYPLAAKFLCDEWVRSKG